MNRLAFKTGTILTSHDDGQGSTITRIYNEFMLIRQDKKRLLCYKLFDSLMSGRILNNLYATVIFASIKNTLASTCSVWNASK